ncbi:MAG: glutathione S-transferase family protein [Magnetococcales bacterium]|nr:glutathione S-transferase family protein [Magnetococcales bacterium]MBF0149487.1 glutathione S-transferase family protein [Magnetococcales bacterium]MBF0631344.1 glutathione S-transferase family protein [Magnetococcales bacterium]
MDLELILFKTCPFAQRTVIVLDHLGISYRKTTINPADRPDWLMECSPMGQVPVLRINGNRAIFDSVAIAEFANDHANGGLLAPDPVQRGLERALVEWSGTCQRAFGECIAARDEAAWHHALADLTAKLYWVEKLAHEAGPCLMGEGFTLVDAAMAPLFMRMRSLQKTVTCFNAEATPKMVRAMDRILAMDVVQRSVEGEFDRMFRMMVRGRGKGGYVDTRMG